MAVVHKAVRGTRLRDWRLQQLPGNEGTLLAVQGSGFFLVRSSAIMACVPAREADVFLAWQAKGNWQKVELLMRLEGKAPFLLCFHGNDTMPKARESGRSKSSIDGIQFCAGMCFQLGENRNDSNGTRDTEVTTASSSASFRCGSCIRIDVRLLQDEALGQWEIPTAMEVAGKIIKVNGRFSIALLNDPRGIRKSIPAEPDIPGVIPFTGRTAQVCREVIGP
eukprot:s3118_g4.t1